MKFEKLDNKLEDMVKETRNTNQRRAGLHHQAQQPRLAMKADVLLIEDKKARERTEDFAQDGRLEDISCGRVHNPMRLTTASVIKITPNLRPSLAGMMPWLIKARKWQSRVSPP